MPEGRQSNELFCIQKEAKHVFGLCVCKHQLVIFNGAEHLNFVKLCVCV